MSALKELIDRSEKSLDSLLAKDARAELAQLRATVEEQARQIESLEAIIATGNKHINNMLSANAPAKQAATHEAWCMTDDPPRPYYDITVLRQKRDADRAALIAGLKRALGFGTCRIVRTSDAAIDNVRCFKREQNKTT